MIAGRLVDGSKNWLIDKSRKKKTNGQ